MEIKATISKLVTIPYTEQELTGMSEKERYQIKSTGYQKVIAEEIIEKVIAENANDLKQKIVGICEKLHPVPIIVYTVPYIEAFLVGSFSHTDIFEIVIINWKQRNSDINDDQGIASWENQPPPSIDLNKEESPKLHQFLNELGLKSREFSSVEEYITFFTNEFKEKTRKDPDFLKEWPKSATPVHNVYERIPFQNLKNRIMCRIIGRDYKHIFSVSEHYIRYRKITERLLISNNPSPIQSKQEGTFHKDDG